jgi:ligand-binding sensor domain-containing protein
LAADTVWAIAFDDAGRAWVGTSGGLNVLDGESWTTYTVADGLAYNDVRAFAFVEDGVWVGTWRGLNHLVFAASE